MQTIPVVFLYLDAPGIESLYAQLSSAVVDGFKTTSEGDKKQSAELKPKFSLGGLLAKFGLASFDVEGSIKYERGSKRGIEATFSLRPENKLVEVIKSLQASGQLHTNLAEALKSASGGRSAYALFEETFRLDHWHAGSHGWIEQANNTGMLTAHLHNQVNVHMGMSLAKTRIGERIGLVSHIAIRARGSDGLFTLKVFGSIQSSYIKPFSVNYWW